MSTAIDNLTSATSRLATSVNAAVTAIGTPGVPESVVQAAADAVNAQSDKLDAAVNPPVAPSTPPE